MHHIWMHKKHHKNTNELMNYCCKCCPVYERGLRTGWYVGDKAHEVMPWYDMQHGPRCEESTDTRDEED